MARRERNDAAGPQTLAMRCISRAVGEERGSRPGKRSGLGAMRAAGAYFPFAGGEETRLVGW